MYNLNMEYDDEPRFDSEEYIIMDSGKVCRFCFWNISSDDVEQMLESGEITEEEYEENRKGIKEIEGCGLAGMSKEQRRKNDYTCDKHTWSQDYYKEVYDKYYTSEGLRRER